MTVILKTRQVGDVTIVDAEGSITLGQDAVHFGDTIRGLAANGHKKILLNLAGISYMDSSGIGEMVSGFTAVANQGGVLKLVKLSERVHGVLVLTGLHTVFEVHADEAQAAASFGAE